MAMIDQFKAELEGGGARSNQFQVFINDPRGINIGLANRKTAFLCRATQLPAQEMAPIEVPFRGRKIYIAGDREFPDPWTTTFINDTDFNIRNAMERWLNGINHLRFNTGVNRPLDYQADLAVMQLDRDNKVLKQYTFRDAWPISISAIDLSSDQADALEEFEVTWRYQHFESTGVTDQGSGSNVTVDIGLQADRGGISFAAGIQAAT